MKAISAVRVRAINLGSYVEVCDNSGARVGKIVSVMRGKSVKRRQVACGIADCVKISVKKGLPEMLGQVFDAVVVRQKKAWRRKSGERISFYNNAVVLLKEKGNPKGTQIKGPIAREVAERWPAVAKLASLIV